MEGQTARPPSRKRLAIILASAVAVATAIVVLFILPAEFNRDPTGFGALTGIDRIAGPEVIDVTAAPAGPNQTARYYPAQVRSDTIEITLPPESDGSELEYKVKMKAGETLVYSFTVTGDEEHPEWFYYDFHGEQRPVPEGTKPTVIEYRKATGLSSSGSLIAPFEGVHGWYVQNQSDKPLVVHLKISGFYELVPPGEYGNERGIQPVAAAEPK